MSFLFLQKSVANLTCIAYKERAIVISICVCLFSLTFPSRDVKQPGTHLVSFSWSYRWMMDHFCQLLHQFKQV